jgi:hypothetical protein
MAVTAVLLLAMGSLAFSLVTMSAAAFYADTVMRRELRTQARLNLEGCLDTAELMAAKDYFLSGSVAIPDFDCSALFTHLDDSHVRINATATLSGVAVSDFRLFQIDPF